MTISFLVSLDLDPSTGLGELQDLGETIESTLSTAHIPVQSVVLSSRSYLGGLPQNVGGVFPPVNQTQETQIQ